MEGKVSQRQAGLAEAQQNVLVLKADTDVAAEKVVKARNELEYARYQQRAAQDLARKGAGPEEDAQKWTAQAGIAEAGVKEAQAELAARPLGSRGSGRPVRAVSDGGGSVRRNSTPVMACHGRPGVIRAGG